MTTRTIVKSILLALPVIVLVYIFFFNRGGNGGVGGGGYDLSKLYYSLFALAYLLVLNIVFLIQGMETNRYFLIAGGLIFVIVLFVLIRMLR